MDKITFIESYIERCDTTDGAQGKLIYEIVYAFGNEIPNIENGLEEFSLIRDLDPSIHAYTQDLEKLKSILINYKLDLQREDKLRSDELRMLELKNQITINNNNTNKSTAISSSLASVNLTINQTLESINQLPEEIIDDEGRQKLEEMLLIIEGMKSKKDKSGIKSKVGNVIKFIADKGVDVFIAVAPFLLQAAN
ncbi:hypothetical protein [Acetobacterium bakii]|uniref:Uncharacterized protein n=1 Tax=Acetobacterium bakii TaxID=52689 RepID=A0A0L6TYG6_9FIRM|nr:hypothetical protein [Acetobacterium bakii]KNZ40610.1 hypothetical protein AKG39_16835 [Acetobacterium bakii]